MINRFKGLFTKPIVKRPVKFAPAANPTAATPKLSTAAGRSYVAMKGDAVSLNPQPLPPKVNPASKFDAVSLNPQPLPPRQVGDLVTSVLQKVSLNPQPLPPKEIGDIVTDLLQQVGIIIVSGKPAGAQDPIAPAVSQDAITPVGQRGVGDEVSLNPQPLPPKEIGRLIDEAIQRVTLRR